MEGWCQTMERDAEDNELPEEGQSEWEEPGSETKMHKKPSSFGEAAHARFVLQFSSAFEMRLAVPRYSCLRRSSSFSAFASKVW